MKQKLLIAATLISVFSLAIFIWLGTLSQSEFVGGELDVLEGSSSTTTVQKGEEDFVVSIKAYRKTTPTSASKYTVILKTRNSSFHMVALPDPRCASSIVLNWDIRDKRSDYLETQRPKRCSTFVLFPFQAHESTLEFVDDKHVQTGRELLISASAADLTTGKWLTSEWRLVINGVRHQ